MLQSPLRPLLPLSALALLGWCWYTFRKKRDLCEQTTEELLASSDARKQSIVENASVQEAATTGGSTLVAHDVNIQSQQKQEGDQNLDHNCSQLSSTINDTSVLPRATQVTIFTSTPIKLVNRIRPEPEGEVSRAQASLLLAEKPETEPGKVDKADKGHSDSQAIETESFAEQPPGIVRPNEHGVTNEFEKQSERSPSLSEADVEVSNGATEEITPIGGGILKRKGHAERRVTPQSQAQPKLQKEIDESNSSVDPKKDLCAFTKTVEESVPLEHRPSDPPSTSSAGEDSGCSTCHSEDGGDEEKTFSKNPAMEKTSTSVSVAPESCHDLDRRNGQLSRQKTDASRGTDGAQSVNKESGFTSHRGSLSMNFPHTLWNIEVPAHLVGRLIGKKGKYVSALKQSSGAKIYVFTLPYTYEFQICRIEGSEVQVEKALALIRKKFKDLDLSNRLSSLQPAAVHSLPVTSWLPLPPDGTVDVLVPRVEAANYLFVQQHTHPTYYSLHTLTEQMLFCYSHSGCPSLPTPVEAGVLCAAPSPDGTWWRAQVIQHYKDSSTVQIRYVDYGGYMSVNLTSLKQIRSDFVSLPFQASEVMLDNIVPLPGLGKFSPEANEALEELTRGIPLIMKVTGSQNGLPLVHLWRHIEEEMISLNGVLVERGLCSWLDSHRS